jgi:hypothetical protein
MVKTFCREFIFFFAGSTGASVHENLTRLYKRCGMCSGRVFPISG